MSAILDILTRGTLPRRRTVYWRPATWRLAFQSMVHYIRNTRKYWAIADFRLQKEMNTTEMCASALLLLIILSSSPTSDGKTLRGILSSRHARLYSGQYITPFWFYGKRAIISLKRLNLLSVLGSFPSVVLVVVAQRCSSCGGIVVSTSSSYTDIKMLQPCWISPNVYKTKT